MQRLCIAARWQPLFFFLLSYYIYQANHLVLINILPLLH